MDARYFSDCRKVTDTKAAIQTQLRRQVFWGRPANNNNIPACFLYLLTQTFKRHGTTGSPLDHL